MATQQATSEAIIARASYDFESSWWLRDGPRPVLVQHLADACRELDAIFRESVSMSHPEWLVQRAEEDEDATRPAGFGVLYQYRIEPDELPHVIYVQMESPFEIVANCPIPFVAGGLYGMLYLAQRVMTFKLEVSARAARLRAEQAKWENERSKYELEVMERQALIVENSMRREERSELPVATLVIDPAE